MNLMRAFLVGAGKYCIAAAKPALVGKMLMRLDALLQVERKELMGYADAVRIALANCPDSTKDARCLLVKRPDPTGFLLIWVYLDADCKPVLAGDGELAGKKLLVSKLDDELTEFFGDGDTIQFN